MRAVAIAVLVLLCAGTAVANPIIGEWIYVDYDPSNFVHSTYPAPYSVVDAYIMMDLTGSMETGFTTVSFKLFVSPDTAINPSFTNLLPGNLGIGSWDTGITLASTECITAFPAQIGRFTFVYAGIPGDVAIYDHPDYARWVVNCQEPGQVFYYCVYSFGGVGKEPDVGPTGDCGGNPVENVTWGSIKSMYR